MARKISETRSRSNLEYITRMIDSAFLLGRLPGKRTGLYNYISGLGGVQQTEAITHVGWSLPMGPIVSEMGEGVMCLGQ